MKRTIRYLLFFSFTQLVLQSCNTTSYLTKSASNDAFSNEAQLQIEKSLVRTQLELNRPTITYELIEQPIIKSHTNIAEKIENNTFISYLEIAMSKILEEADSYIGTPYRFGGTTRRGIDCSAFMQKIYRVQGIDLPRVSRNQAKVGVPIPKENLQKGDLIFFSTTSPTRITHVGMVYETKDDEVLFIHASSSQGVTISSLNHNYWAKRYRTARRIDEFVSPQLVLNNNNSNETIN